MRFVSRALLAGLSGVAVSLLTACGSSGSLLSADQGSTLTAQLNSVAAAYAAHNCAAAVSAAATFQNSASSLSGVDPALSNAVAQGAQSLLDKVKKACPTHTNTPSTTTSTPTTTTTTSSTPTTTSTPTTSTPTTSTPTPTTTTPAPTTTTPPPATTSTGTGTSSTGGAGIGGGGGGY